MKCNICGGDLIAREDGLLECEFCGNVYHDTAVKTEIIQQQEQEVEQKLEDALRAKSRAGSAQMLELAEENRQNGDYDEAYYAYQGYLENHPEDARGYWGKVLSKFGILYETEQVGSRTIQKPTLNRMSGTSILDDEDYHKAIYFATGEQKEAYKAAAKEIEKIQKHYMSLVLKEKPYDVFISFKAKEKGSDKTTRDSSIAYEIYERLNALGNLNVFFSRITLQERMAGGLYEPYIYSALNTAKVMILVGTSTENVNSQWVKNEWSRFLVQMQKDSSKVIIPVVEGMALHEMPERIPLGNGLAYQGEETLAELTEGVLNITGKGRVVDAEEEKTAMVILQDQLKTKCEKGDFAVVRSIADEILDIDAKCGDAYYYLLLAEYHVTKGIKLADLDEPWMDSSYYKYAQRYGDETLKNRLEAIKERYELRQEDIYEQAELKRKQVELEENFQQAKQLMKKFHYKAAKDILVTKAFRHPEAQKCMEICNMGIEAQNRIGDRNTYLKRMLEEKNPHLFGKWNKAMADLENLVEPALTTGQGLVTAGSAGIGVLLAGILSTNHPYMAIIVGIVLAVIASSACENGLLRMIALPLGIFSMLLEWGAASYNHGIGGMTMSMLLVVLIIYGVVAILRRKAYDSNEKENQAIMKEVEIFFEKERQEIVERYQPVLGEKFIKEYGPK